MDEQPRSGSRRLVAVLVGLLVVAAGVTLVALATSDDGPSRNLDEAAPGSSPSDRSAGGDGVDDLEIFMRVDASADDIRSIEQELDADNDVESYVHLDKQDALEEFRRMFADDPDLSAGVTADDLPVSFRVSLDDPKARDEVAERFEGGAGVERVVVASTPDELAVEALREGVHLLRDYYLRWRDFDLEAFLEVDSSAREIEQVREVLEADPRVAELTLLTKEDAARDFHELFPDEEEVTADDLPPSFRVRLRNRGPESSGAFAAQIENIDGIVRVVVPEEEAIELLRDLDARGVLPDETDLPTETEFQDWITELLSQSA